MPCPMHRGKATLGCALQFSDDATSNVILPALIDFAKGGQQLCFKPTEDCLPQARISPAPLCALCVTSFALLSVSAVDSQAPSPPLW